MFQKEIAFYLGEEKSDGFTGYIAEDGLFLILEIPEGLTAETGRELLKKLKEKLLAVRVEKLADFEHHIVESITEINLPSGFSLAAGLLKDEILYLKSIGEGEIYIHRNNQSALIIAGDESASGYAEIKDLFIFTTMHFTGILGGLSELKKIFDHRTPHEIVDEITPKLKSKDEAGAVSLFVEFKQAEESNMIAGPEGQTEEIQMAVPQEEPLFVSHVKPWEKLRSAIRSNYIRAQQYSQQGGRKKTLTFAVMVIVCIIFVWSVGFGVMRRNEALADQEFQTTKASVTQKLQEANDVAYVNLPKAQSLIADAKTEVSDLKKKLGNKKQSEINQLDQTITDQENKITKKEEKPYAVFYDLTLDNAKASVSRGYLSSDIYYLLDKAQGFVYNLSLSKKSIDKETNNILKKADLIASYQNDIFVYVDGEGIYKLTAAGVLSKIIDNDPDWGKIADISVYNGNLYLLDTGKNDIWKYLVAENGYSAKSSYFKENHPDLSQANSIAIDSSVYIGFPDKILKYTAGVSDDFTTSYPNPNTSIVKVITNKDLDKVYAWDKSKASIYVLGKDGSYEKEINAGIIAKSSDFTVYDGNAYLPEGSKIYQISVQ